MAGLLGAFFGSSIQEYPTYLSFPPNGSSNYLYLDLATNDLYYWDGAAFTLTSGGGGGGGPSTTDDLIEGSTNLYYTNTRVDARIDLHEGEADPHPQYTTSAEVSADVSSAISAIALNDISDVDINEPALQNNDVLCWIGAEWKARSIEDLTMRAYSKQVDEVDATTTYIGEANPGSGTDFSSAVWRIQQITFTGDDIQILWAEGNSDFDKVWDDRESYSYT